MKCLKKKFETKKMVYYVHSNALKVKCQMVYCTFIYTRNTKTSREVCTNKSNVIEAVYSRVISFLGGNFEVFT